MSVDHIQESPSKASQGKLRMRCGSSPLHIYPTEKPGIEGTSWSVGEDEYSTLIIQVDMRANIELRKKLVMYAALHCIARELHT